MSKRYLRQLVEEGHVDGWDDPRMPSLCALRRRGYTPSSIIEFVKKAGVAKAYSTVDIRLLEHCIREELNASAPRRMAVLDPIKVTLTNYPQGREETFPIANNPLDESAGVREVAFSGSLYIDREDFAELPPPKWQRLTPGGEARLMGAYIIRCEEMVKTPDGKITELRCTADLESGNRKPADGRKVKGAIHWVSAAHAVNATARLYENLFTLENVNEAPEGANYLNYLNPESLLERPNAKLEAALAGAKPGERFQFVRTGYFCADSKRPDAFNRIVQLKDSFRAE
jgi:glutaminyl-tRNA synthetase